ncbi:Tetraspanin family [Popillia japonica]|uniref:Tetraspanin n=1 Tax=Popillia japonica TaxID=7064 RepID=A0AAW1JY09_POPJA
MTSLSDSVCIRYFVLLLNAFFVLSGIIITSLGIYIKGYYYSYEPFVKEQYLYAPDFLIALGAVIFFIAFVGCCGLVTENSCMSLTFTTFLILIFFFEMALGLAGYIMKEETNNYLREKLPNTMMKYNTSADIHLAWDTLQSTFQCCGVKDAKDWEKAGMKIPNSCHDSFNDSKTYQVGCMESFGGFIKKHSNYIEIAGVSLSMFQLVGIVCSCLLANEYRKGYETI